MMRGLTSTGGEWWLGSGPGNHNNIPAPHTRHGLPSASVVLRMLTRAALPVFSLSLFLTVGVGEAQNWGWGWGAQQKQKQPETYQNRQKYQSNQEFYYDYDEDDYYDGKCRFKKVNF